jgi:hypothetical protein
MDNMRASILAILLMALALSAPLAAPRLAAAHPEDGRVLTGELVVLQPGSNQFRLVGHGGSFRAPAGMDLTAIDGKPVRVEFTSGGRVAHITPYEIPIDPIAHSREVASGQLVVRDPVARTFNFAGDGQVYVAPPGVDINAYAGQMVQVEMQNGSVQRLMLVDRTSRAIPPMPPRPSTSCLAGGVTFPDGSMRCDAGQQMLCDRGSWRDLGAACPSNVIGRAPQSCTFGGATVADGSTICRSGATYRCSSGTWVNENTPCS